MTFICLLPPNGNLLGDDRANDSLLATSSRFLLFALIPSSDRWTLRLDWRRTGQKAAATERDPESLLSPARNRHFVSNCFAVRNCGRHNLRRSKQQIR